MPGIDKKKLRKVGLLLFQFEGYLLCKEDRIVTEEMITSRFNNDPIFNKVAINLLVEITNTKEVIGPMSEAENVEYLMRNAISIGHNSKSKVMLIRQKNVSADFYTTKNKWKDNNHGQRIYYGDSVRFLKWVENQLRMG